MAHAIVNSMTATKTAWKEAEKELRNCFDGQTWESDEDGREIQALHFLVDGSTLIDRVTEWAGTTEVELTDEKAYCESQDDGPHCWITVSR